MPTLSMFCCYATRKSFVVYCLKKNPPFPSAGPSRAVDSWWVTRSHVPEPYHQYWGLPFTMTACAKIQPRARLWSHLWVHGVQLKSVQIQLHAAFCRELCWVVGPEMPAAIRRKDFPSWSWSGWIAPVAWASTSPLT